MKLFYDYIFYRLYKSVNIINKSIPEWSIIIALSTILFLNIFSILIFFNFPIKHVNIFIALQIFILIIHYFVFLKNKRFLKIIKQFNNSKNKKNLFHDILILCYFCFSYLIFSKFLGLVYESSIPTLLLMILGSLFVFFKTRLK